MNRSSMRVGLAQICSTDDPLKNLDLISNSLLKARREKCELLIFPENALYRGPHCSSRPIVKIRNGSIHLDSSIAWMYRFKEILEASEIPMVMGSVLEQLKDSKKPANTLMAFQGKKILCRYRKIHLFDFQGQSIRYFESERIQSGSRPEVFKWDDFIFGASICYDLRFPELYRALVSKKKAEVLLVPAAFTYETGEAHWHTLLRARAIENQSYVLAPAQWGSHLTDGNKSARCFGHTVAYDPWGDCLGDLGDSENALLVVELSKERLQSVRTRLPALKHRRL